MTQLLKQIDGKFNGNVFKFLCILIIEGLGPGNGMLPVGISIGSPLFLEEMHAPYGNRSLCVLEIMPGIFFFSPLLLLFLLLMVP